MIEVRVTKSMGRGLFATLDIKAGETVHTAEFIKLKDVELENCPSLGKYVFTYTKKHSVLCLGLGSLFNHSDNPNTEAYFDKFDGREVMGFMALKDISVDEQLFISYGGEEYAFYHLLKKVK